MGIFEYLLGSSDRDRDDTQPPPSKGGAGPDVDKGRHKTETEKNLRLVQGQHDPDTDSFKDEMVLTREASNTDPSCRSSDPTLLSENKPPQEDLRERERRHINRDDDPHFDPTDKTSHDKIPGADQAPNHEVKRATDAISRH